MLRSAIVLGFALLAVGCGKETATPAPRAVTPAQVEEIAAERAKLDPADRALVEGQEWCVVSEGERLGSMGAPLKLDVNGTAVFVCCASCKGKAVNNPERTLAKLAELQARAKATPAK